MTPRPSVVNEHALDRFIERWCRPDEREPEHRAAHARMLRELIRRAVPGEHMPDERQQIWTVTVSRRRDHQQDDVTIKLVVDMNGAVRTVLPEGAERPPSRRIRHG